MTKSAPPTFKRCEVIAMQPQDPDRNLRIKAALALTGLTRSTLYRKMEAGTFPQNTQISTRCMGWRESVITAWLKNPISYDTADRGPG
ncbi:helix-turn-helix transcriptional regulator [Sphingomonas sp. 22176]|uniref:helix-turn-helix transcriptional regulator n=1 Tax=Sphingomonas sp. 22176 TaxID=3453884 RepID=UPI003F83C846